MCQYFKNLLIALCGQNPYRLQLEELKKTYEKTVESVELLNDVYHREQEKRVAVEKQVTSCQVLVENLRQHLKDKDELMEKMKENFQKRLEAYNQEINDLVNRPKSETQD